MSITSKQGDGGKTRLANGEEVSKNTARMDALGDLDELTSMLGVARTSAKRKDTVEALLEVQKTLHDVFLEVAGANERANRQHHPIDERSVKALTQKCRDLEGRVSLPRTFVIPGSTPGGAQLDVARAIARRCERRIVGLIEDGEMSNQSLIPWMNRLSDYLWLLARFEELGGSGGFARMFPLQVHR